MRVLVSLLFCSIIGALNLVSQRTKNNQEKGVYSQELNKFNRLVFEENLGQFVNDEGDLVPHFYFKSEDQNLQLFLTSWGLTYYFVHKNEHVSQNNYDNRKETLGWERLDMLLEGADIIKENIIKEGKSKAYSNYYYAHCPNGILGVHKYEKLTIKNVYPKIDWVLYQEENHLKYDFIVHPGGDPSLIKIRYKGVDELKIVNEKNKLSIKGKKISFKDEKLMVSSGNNIIKSSFKRLEDKGHLYTISILEPYDKEKMLIIDPVLSWSTYLGSPAGNNGDNGFDVALNSTHVFITGSVNSLSFPTVNPGGGAYFQSVYGGGTGAAGDIPISKFTHTGTLEWSTYYGGSNNESGHSIEIDNSNIYIVGYTYSTNLPVQNPGGGAYFQGANGGNADAFILKFNLAGVRQWATYYGGASFDEFDDVTILGGTVFAVGVTQSANFPTQNPFGGAHFQGSYGGGTQDGVITKFNSSGVRQWSTYYGGSGGDAFLSATNDGTRLYVAGYSNSANFSTLNPGGGAYFQGTNGGNNDNVILSFNATNANRIWATYFGGNGEDYYPTIDCDASSIYYTSITGSTNFPTLNPGGGAYFQGTNAGSQDATISRFSLSGVMQWSTYYGGTGNEFFGLVGNKISANSNNLYVTFRTINSADIPLQVLAGSYNQTYNGGQESAIIEFALADNSRTWASYFGGTQTDIIWGISSSDSYLYLTGVTTSTAAQSFPLVDQGGGAFYDGVYSNSFDTYFSQFSVSPCGACALGGSGATWTWTGCVGTDWFDPCNWDRQSVPTVSSNVIIPNTANKPLVSGAIANCLDLTIQTSTGARVDVNTSTGGLINVLKP